MVADLSPVARPLPPGLARCPACGQERPLAELRRKGHRLSRCNACYQAQRQQGRHRWEQHNRERRTKQRHGGGVPCPPYTAWTVEACGTGVFIVSVDPLAPEATVLPAYGACSCGVAGCVHLVVACLAQQGEGGGDG